MRSSFGAESPDASRVVHCGIFERYVMSVCAGGTIGWLGLYELVAHGDYGAGVVFLGLAAFVVWMLAFRIALQIGPDLVIRNPLRTTRVAIEDVVAANPEYAGLRLTLRSGKSLVVAAVQRHNLAVVLGRKTRADRIAEEVMRRANDARAVNRS